MLQLKYEKKEEKFEDETEEEITIEITEITAESDHTQKPIEFQKDGKLLAKTITDINGIAICGFTETKECIVKAIVADEEAEIVVK